MGEIRNLIVATEEERIEVSGDIRIRGNMTAKVKKREGKSDIVGLRGQSFSIYIIVYIVYIIYIIVYIL